MAGSPQYEWLVNDLASVNRSVTPWLVVGFHRVFSFDDSPASPLAGPMYFAELNPSADKIAEVLCFLDPTQFHRWAAHARRT